MASIQSALSPLLALALACFGCSRGPNVVQVTLDMDRDRWELPHTAERVKLRRAENMIIRVALVNSTDQPVTVLQKGSKSVVDGVTVLVFHGTVMLQVNRSMCFIDACFLELEPGQRVIHHIYLNLYGRLGEPLPAGGYRLRLMFRLRESKRELPLLDKWVELEIID